MEQGADEVAGDASLWQELDRGADVSAAALGQPVASVDSEAETERRIARLRRVVDSHQAELERCYTEASAGGAGQSLQGRIDIRFTLMSDGRTAGVSSSRNTTGSGQLADCVAGLVRAWRFPAREDPLELEWPFLFHPAAD